MCLSKFDLEFWYKAEVRMEGVEPGSLQEFGGVKRFSRHIQGLEIYPEDWLCSEDSGSELSFLWLSL
jgi:hypothetical protein